MQTDLFTQPLIANPPAPIPHDLRTVRHAPPATKTEPILSVEKKHRWQINTPKPLLYAIWKEMKRRKIPWSLLRDAVLQATNKETDSEEKLHESEALEIMRQLGIAPRKV